MTRRILFALFLAALIAPTTPPVMAADSQDGFIRSVGQQAIDSLTGTGVSAEEREKRFREIFNRAFEVKLLARFTLGRYWRRATKEQKEEYVSLFEDFVVKAYAARFSDYSGEKFNVGGIRDVKGGDALVASEIVLNDGRKIPVHWRVRSNGGYKIVDVLVEGVSMAITQRDEFSAIINQNGGKIDGLLAALRKRTGK